MTEGAPTRLLLSFAGPVILGSLLTQAYGWINTFIIGQSLGVADLGALGTIGTFTYFIYGFTGGLSIGFTICLSTARGTGDEALFQRYWCGVVCISLASGLLLIVGMQAALAPLLRLMATPADIAPKAESYSRVFFCSLLFYTASTALTAVLHALGDSRLPVVVSTIGCGLNIVLDVLLMLVFKLGLAGAAWTTVISQTLSIAVYLAYLRRNYPHLLRFWRRLPKGADIARLLKTGLPMALQSSFTAVGVMALQRTINAFGTQVAAAFAAVSRLENVATVPHAALGVAAATYTAQNHGAGQPKRIVRGMRAGLALVLGISVAASAILLLFGRGLLGIFISAAEVQVLDYASQYLFYLAVFLPCLGAIAIFRNTVQGLGDGLVPMLVGLLELVLRAALAVLVQQNGTFQQLCQINPTIWVIVTVVLGLWCFLSVRRVCRRAGKQHPA